MFEQRAHLDVTFGSLDAPASNKYKHTHFSVCVCDGGQCEHVQLAWTSLVWHACVLLPAGRWRSQACTALRPCQYDGWFGLDGGSARTSLAPLLWDVLKTAKACVCVCVMSRRLTVTLWRPKQPTPPAGIATEGLLNHLHHTHILNIHDKNVVYSHNILFILISVNLDRDL